MVVGFWKRGGDDRMGESGITGGGEVGFLILLGQ